MLVTVFCCQREKKTKTKRIIKKKKKKIFEGFQPVNIIVWEWKVNEPFKTVIVLAAFCVRSAKVCHISTCGTLSHVISQPGIA